MLNLLKLDRLQFLVAGLARHANRNPDRHHAGYIFDSN
jgi:hypothetical protein